MMRHLIRRCAGVIVVGSALMRTMPAQSTPEYGAFVMRRGTDLIATEKFAWHGDTLRGTIELQGQPRLEYLARIRPDLTPSSLALTVANAGGTPRRMTFRLDGDSVIADVNGAPQRFAVAPHAVPLLNNSWATMELLTRRARAAHGELTAPVWALANAAPLQVVLSPIGDDSMTVTVAGQVTRLRVDGAGHILGGILPAQGIALERVYGAAAGAVPDIAARSVALPAGLSERSVTVSGPVPLPGTFTLPAGPGPFPVVVLVHGSGAGDRDETIGPNKPFRDLAWGLAQHGIAVLRYDKRAFVQPSWYAGKNFTVYDETVQDALSALALARAQPHVDHRRSFLIGLSLGAMLAPRIATADGQVAGIVIMAGATRMPLIDQMSRQFAYFDSIAGPDSAATRAQRDAFAPIAARVKALQPADSANPTPLPGLGGTGTRYWLDLNGYDPALTMRTLQVPALVLAGLRDYQVPPDQLDAWLTAIGPRKDITVKRYPGLNHLFMFGTGTPSPVDYSHASHVDPQVIADIAAWISRQPPR